MFFTGDFFSVIRFLFWPLSLIYGLIVWLRNRLYDVNFFSSVEFSIPVISVGNLSTGGTGKTPHVEYLIRLLQYEYTVATLSRGYKRHTQGFLLAGPGSNALHIGDEPMQYRMKFPEAVVAVGEERMTAIPQLLQQRPDVDVILLDDAYQHRSVKAGLNILITDFSKPYYKDYILPLGRLREGRSAANRADVIVVSKCPPGLAEADALLLRTRLKPKAYQQVFFTAIAYERPYGLFSGTPLRLAGSHIILVCGIAKPKPLIDYLEAQAAAVHVLSYPDHHYFGSQDLKEIKAAYDNWDVADKLVVTTEKDAARLHVQHEILAGWGFEPAVLPVRTEVLFEEGAHFGAMLREYVANETAAQNPQPEPVLLQGISLPATNNPENPDGLYSPLPDNHPNE